MLLTLSSSRVKPFPARTRVLYLKVGQRTTGRSAPPTGRGATRRAFFCRAARRRCFRAGWLNHVRTYLQGVTKRSRSLNFPRGHDVTTGWAGGILRIRTVLSLTIQVCRCAICLISFHTSACFCTNCTELFFKQPFPFPTEGITRKILAVQFAPALAHTHTKRQPHGSGWVSDMQNQNESLIHRISH